MAEGQESQHPDRLDIVRTDRYLRGGGRPSSTTMLAPMFQVTAPHEDLRIDATTRSGAVQPQSTKSIGYLPAKTNTGCRSSARTAVGNTRSEEHTSELQSRGQLV